ncbi:MAG: histidinol phosphatase [Flavobacteriales bacterium]|nr:histidinol phosphatase [Flavobacteriales bacterium]
MLSLFKPKLRLSDLTENGLVDIHSHFLPGIDDGSPDVETSINLINQAKQLGFKEFICTPHIIGGMWDNNDTTISNAEQKLKKSLDKDTILSYGAEHMIDHEFAIRLKEGDIVPLKDNYVLVEFSFLAMPNFAMEVLFDLQVAGYIPILAHPERYLYLYKDFEKFEELKKAGCLFQINLLSLTNYYGDEVNYLAQKMIDKGMYDFLGSDIHAQKHINYYSKPIKKKNLPYLKELLHNNSSTFSELNNTVNSVKNHYTK